MTLTERVWDILFPEHPPLDALAADHGELPDRVVNRTIECSATITDDFDHEAVCPFAGPADVAVFEDTREALWVCPFGHENSIRWVEL